MEIICHGIRNKTNCRFRVQKDFWFATKLDGPYWFAECNLGIGSPIEAVEVLNPFSYQEFAENKLIVLDVRCRDSTGRWLNVEMQVSVYSGLLERMAYYAGRMYVDQLEVGQNYAKATPAISICLLDKRIFPETEQAHHRFQLIDRRSGRELENAIEVHTVELTKYNLSESTIANASKLQQWAFLLLHAHEYEASELRRLLKGLEFDQAINTIAIISATTEDRQMYDQREKAQRDYEWAMSGAREEGREEGLEIGIQRGKLSGSIQTLQGLLGDNIAGDAELRGLALDALQEMVATLQQRLRDRQV
jgi:predicted transposase/invertase (TIGR01784 family)